MYNGLTNAEVMESKKIYGSNDIGQIKKDSFFKILINTLGDPIIKILLIALAIKTVFLFKSFDWYETIGIVISILLASFISTISEYGSEKSFEKLQDEVSKINSKVIREGKKIEIPINEVVVNDIVSLEVGDKIPADGIIVKGKIGVDESSLNGETKEVYKESVLNLKNISDKNRVFKGSVVYSNTALMKVTEVGENTFYGQIALELQENQPETPLKLRLRELAKFISKIGYIGAALVFFSYLFKVIVINNNFDLRNYGRKFLNAYVNGDLVGKDEMYPVFKLVQELYSTAYANFAGKNYHPKYPIVCKESLANYKKHTYKCGYIAFSKLKLEDLQGDENLLPPNVYMNLSDEEVEIYLKNMKELEDKLKKIKDENS